ncbi:MAG: hypothetical protein RSD88_03880 [Anaerovoracaceae bacterium]
MTQKTIAMAAAFTMFLSLGVVGIAGESIHQTKIYQNQTVQQQQIAPTLETVSKLMLVEPSLKNDK